MIRKLMYGLGFFIVFGVRDCSSILRDAVRYAGRYCQEVMQRLFDKKERVLLVGVLLALFVCPSIFVVKTDKVREHLNLLRVKQSWIAS